jgi:acyl carrier protein
MTGNADQVRDLVAAQLGLDRVEPGDRLVEDLGAESIDIVSIVATLEETYQVSVEEERLPRLRTVQDLADEIARLTGEG